MLASKHSTWIGDFYSIILWTIVDLGHPEELFDDDDYNDDRVNETHCATQDDTRWLRVISTR